MLKEIDELDWENDYKRYRDIGNQTIFGEQLTRKFDEYRNKYKDYKLSPLTGMTSEIKYKIYKSMYEYEAKIIEETNDLYS